MIKSGNWTRRRDGDDKNEEGGRKEGRREGEMEGWNDRDINLIQDAHTGLMPNEEGAKGAGCMGCSNWGNTRVCTITAPAPCLNEMH